MKITLLIFLFLIIFLLCELNIVKSIDNNLFAIVISTSSTFENFRHSTNVMMFYQYFKKIGIPDYKVCILTNIYYYYKIIIDNISIK